MPSGETFSGPRSCMIVCCSSIVVMPPIPVPITQAERSGSPGAPSSQPASAIASPAAVSASWVKRSERRTSLTDRCSLGSNSSQRPSPSSMPGAAGAPALVERARPHAERRDRPDAGDHDAAPHDSFDITRSTA